MATAQGGNRCHVVSLGVLLDNHAELARHRSPPTGNSTPRVPRLPAAATRPGRRTLAFGWARRLQRDRCAEARHYRLLRPSRPAQGTHPGGREISSKCDAPNDLVSVKQEGVGRDTIAYGVGRGRTLGWELR